MTSETAAKLPGKYRRFGPRGPVYEILGVAGERSDGDTVLRVRVLKTGEEAEYRLSQAIEDPEEP